MPYRRFAARILTLILAFVGGVALTGAATITGRITDDTGAPPPSVWVAALDAADDTVLDSSQSTDGTYALEVADGQDVTLIAVALSGGSVAGYDLHEYTDAIVRLFAVEGTVTRNLGVRRCREYVLEVRRADGTLYRQEELPPGAFPVDGEGEATAELLWAVDNPDTGARVPSLCVPLGERRTLIFRLELPGAGLLNLPLALDGGDFIADEPGGELVDVNRELALTQLERVESRIDELGADGFAVPPELAARAAVARALFDGFEGMPPELRAGSELRVAADAVLTLEEVELANADRQALEHRRGWLQLRVIGRDGLRAAGARVTYQQTSHDFRFGIFGQLATTGQAVYDRMALAGLNFVTAGYYWSSIEPERGQIDFDLIDHQVGVVDLADRGWRIKGHPLTWLYGFAMPDWLKAMGFDELKQTSVDHVTTLINHYMDRVHTWDVNNEAASYGTTGGLARAQIDEYLEAVYTAARSADPAAELVLNSAFDWFGRDRLTERLDGRSSYVTLSIPAFLQRAVDSGIDFDVVGQQLYNGGGVTWFHDVGLGPVTGVPTHDLGFIAQVLRRLAAFGRPIHVTEISVSSAWDPAWVAAGAGFWHAPWSEGIQAEYLEAFYRLCFGTPAVHAVTWWDAMDDNPFVNHGALFHADGTPKPALLRLESLIAGWTSGGEITTGEDGTAAVQGFAGDYRISVDVGGEVHERRAHISEGATTILVVDLRLRSAPRRATGRVP